MIEFLRNYQQELDGFRDKLRENAGNYYTARVSYAVANSEINKRIAKLMFSEDWAKIKSYGFEKLLIVTIKDAIQAGDDDYVDLCTHWEVNRAKYKGLDKAIGAGQTDIMAVQSLMKYQREGDTYGKVD